MNEHIKKGEGAHGLTLKESCFIIDRSFLLQYSLNEILYSLYSLNEILYLTIIYYPVKTQFE